MIKNLDHVTPEMYKKFTEKNLKKMHEEKGFNIPAKCKDVLKKLNIKPISISGAYRDIDSDYEIENDYQPVTGVAEIMIIFKDLNKDIDNLFSVKACYECSGKAPVDEEGNWNITDVKWGKFTDKNLIPTLDPFEWHKGEDIADLDEKMGLILEEIFDDLVLANPVDFGSVEVLKDSISKKGKKLCEKDNEVTFRDFGLKPIKIKLVDEGEPELNSWEDGDEDGSRYGGIDAESTLMFEVTFKDEVEDEEVIASVALIGCRGKVEGYTRDNDSYYGDIVEYENIDWDPDSGEVEFQEWLSNVSDKVDDLTWDHVDVLEAELGQYIGKCLSNHCNITKLEEKRAIKAHRF